MRIWNFNNCVARDRVKGFKGYAIHYPYIYSCLSEKYLNNYSRHVVISYESNQSTILHGCPNCVYWMTQQQS